jgi:hypothetical protein
VDLADLEAGGELVEGEDLLLGARRPAEEGQEVDERLGQVALLAVRAHGHLRLALAHLGAVGVQDERDVPEARLSIAEGAHECDVLRRVRKMVLAADDVRDLHRLVVDHHREVVERHAVVAHDHEVPEKGVVELDLATHEVVEADDLR